MKQSDELTAFYQAYQDWMKAGAPESTTKFAKNPYWFLRGVGLCANLRYFCIHHGCYNVDATYGKELTDQFIEAGLAPRYPFHKSEQDFYQEVHLDLCHLNLKRMQWVIDHCEPKEEQSCWYQPN